MSTIGATPLKLGFLAFAEHTGVTATANGVRSNGLERGIELFERAEDLGYDRGWIRVRHLQDYISAPFPFLATAGARTSRIGLGTAVIPVRFELVARLAEDAATTDLLTGGRIHLGLSSGYTQGDSTFDGPFGSLGGDLRQVTDARVTELIGYLRGDTVATADESFAHAEIGTPLQIQPQSPGLLGRTSYGSGSQRSAERTAHLGLGLQLSTLQGEFSDTLGFEELQARAIQVYRGAWGGAEPGQVSITRQMLPVTRTGDLDDYAWLTDRDRARQSDLERARREGDRLPVTFGRVVADSPEVIAEHLRSDPALAMADELVIALPFDHPHDVVVHILETFAREVAPLLRA